MLNMNVNISPGTMKKAEALFYYTKTKSLLRFIFIVKYAEDNFDNSVNGKKKML